MNIHIKSALLFSILVFSFSIAEAQMHCRSTLGGHLTPFHKKVPVLWAVEATMAPGVMTSPIPGEEPAMLNGGMLIGAIDFTTNKHTIYVEGGYKNWKNSTLAQTVSESSRHVGVRQAFYGFKRDNSDIKLGLHETKLGNYFLIDERIFGASINQEIGAFSLNARAGTVIDNFARMGRFCGNRHLYSLITNDFTENIGEKAGETNLGAIVLNWNPSYKNQKVSEPIDEFSDFSSEENNPKNDKLISNIGLIFYDEFGEIIPDNKLYIGSILDFDLPADLKFQTGVIYQNMKLNNTLVYIANLNRKFTWKSGTHTKVDIGYIGKYNIDNNAIFQPLFSNLFLGEVMRLDATDFPLWKTSVIHNFPGKLKFNIGLRGVGQIEAYNTSEIDIELGLKLLKHAKITTILSWVSSEAFQEEIYMGRLELRIAF
jgi:hypothetical protein